MLGAMVFGLFLSAAIYVGIVVALMWAADRWLGKLPAIVVCGLAFAYIGYTIVSGMIYCAADPIYIPPTDAEAAAGSEGAMHFNCDSAGGIIDRVYLYFVGPLTMIALAFLALRASRKKATNDA